MTMLIKQNIINDVGAFNLGFRVVLSEAKDVSRKPLQIGVLDTQAIRTPINFRFSSSLERSEGYIEKTIANRCSHYTLR